MNTPFVFGKIATDKDFTDREDETNLLVSNFSSLINTIIISPRRWGKSSLVNKASKIAAKQDKTLRICHIDLFNVRDEEDFYLRLIKEILSKTSSKWEDAVRLAKKYLSGLGSDATIELDWGKVYKNADEVLDLAENIAKKKNLKIVICIDEFQNIAEFKEPEFFQKVLRSHWQRQQHVSYCLCGSKRHMMLDIFTAESKPFFNFGSIIFLEKIKTDYLVDFISNRFSDTGKSIELDASKLIVELADNHPYYVQQLAQQAWLRTKEECTLSIVQESHTTLVEQLSLLFLTITEALTTQQLNFLKAFLSEEKAISSLQVMNKYHLSSTTAITRSKEALVEKDILDNKAGVYSFQNPLYKYWLKKEYFDIKD